MIQRMLSVCVGICTVFVCMSTCVWSQSSDELFRMAEQESDSLHKFVLLTDAIENNQDSYWPFLHMAYLQRGELYRQMGFDEESLEDLSRSLVYFNGQAKAHYLRAEIFMHQKKWDYASQELMEAEEKDAYGFTRFIQRGEAYFYASRYKEAIYDFDSAINRGIVTVPMVMMKILAQLNIYEFEQALKDLNGTREKLDQDAVYFFLKGLIYYLMFRERNWVLHQGQKKLVDASHDSVLLMARDQASESLARAQRLGFVLSQDHLWSHLGRVREFLNDFLRFYDAQR